MTNRTKIVGGMIATALVAVLVFVAVQFFGNRLYRESMALQQQLVDSDDLSSREREKLVTRLMQTVDQLDREQKSELRRAVFQQYREQSRSNIDEFHSASLDEQPAVLDKHLQWMAAWRRVGEAMPRGGYRGRRDRNRGRGDDRGRDSEESELSEEERKVQRELQIAYYGALQKRAEESGFEMPGRRRRGR